jgi:RecB family exonuclease
VFARHLSEGPIGEEALEQVCREEIGRSMNQKISALGLRPSELGGVIREVGDLYDRFKRLSVDGFESAEVYLEVEPAEGVTLRGSIDAVFGDPEAGTRLVDWKTGSVFGAEEQLEFYAMLWALERGELPGAVEAMSISTGERFSAVPTPADTQQTAQRVARLVSELRRAFASGDDLERRGGAWCRFCPLLETCDEGSAATAVFSG